MTDTTTTPTTDHQPQTPLDRSEAPKPLFTDFGVAQDLADVLRSRGIVHPFPIQELTLPLGLKGHDIIGQARTGTGKTLGFGLPLLQRIDTSKAQTQALVIVPTRELCIQVADDLTVGAGRGVTSIAVYGGVGYDEQIEALTTGVHVVVGTPGRTLDHLGRGNLDVTRVHTVVLDEADEMLDMGFLPDVERLLADVPTERQTLLFSATMPTAIVKLARRFMDKPTFMRADETLHETAPTVDQHFFLVHRMDKPRVLARLLQMPGRGGAFVFCRTKRMCDRLVQELDGLGLAAIAVHGDLRQSSRERNLDKFRAGTADVLVATEVAARGLDVSNVSHVVNYDCPDDEKMYLHRIGRTARAGESGVAVTFAEFNEVDRVNVIRKRVGTEKELTEVFSTSDALTELFDLPETTPWDDLTGSSTRSSNNSSKRSGSGHSSKGSSGRSPSRGSGERSSRGNGRASSSGSNRSSRRDTDRRDRTDERRSTASSQRPSSDRSSSDRSTSDRSTSDRSTSESSSRRSSSDDGDRRRSRTRSRDGATDRRDTSRSSAEASTTRSTGSDAGESSPSRGRASDADTDRSSGTSSSSSGGRKRARRNRRRGGSSDGSSSNSPSSRSSSSGSSSSGSSSSESSSRGSTGRDRGSRDSGTSGRNGTERSGNDRRSGSSRGRSSSDDARSSRNGSDAPVRTTSRGSDARGDGTPRLDRRVDVEHLP